jgi:class 3 adenylate cyclase/pimeloyl-ACP methyl ester carboxylesterase
VKAVVLGLKEVIMGGVPETRYLRTSDGAYIAYQVVGDGPVDIAFGFNSDESNVDLMWEEPDWRPFLTGAAEFGRVIVHDRRGIGVSSRNVPPPNLETQVADLLAVLDTAESHRPILVGSTGSGAMHALFAATHPDRTGGLLWNNPAGRTAWAPDYPWGLGLEDFERSMRESLSWGTTSYGSSIAQWRAAERAGVPESELDTTIESPERVNTYAKINRNTATPDVAREILRIDWETDVRAILPSVRTPTALVTGTRDNVEEVEYIASLMPHAVVHVIEGRSGVAAAPILQILREMGGVELPPAGLDTVLSTVLFTDIVGSTKRQAELGDRAWKTLVERHHAVVRAGLIRWRGVENDTAGDGFYATFDGPARAVRCALEITERIRELGLEIRAGVHTGECELIDGKCGGISVTTGARISALAAPSQVLVSQTVKDLVAGSGLSFQEVGDHELKGVPGRWQLYAVLK